MLSARKLCRPVDEYEKLLAEKDAEITALKADASWAATHRPELVCLRQVFKDTETCLAEAEAMLIECYQCLVGIELEVGLYGQGLETFKQLDAFLTPQQKGQDNA